MMGRALEQLLGRLVDGTAGDGDLERARELLACDDRLPEELRAVLDAAEQASESAAALLSLLSEAHDPFAGAVAVAVREEAGVPQIPVPQDASWSSVSRELRAGVDVLGGRVDVAAAVCEAV